MNRQNGQNNNNPRKRNRNNNKGSGLKRNQFEIVKATSNNPKKRTREEAEISENEQPNKIKKFNKKQQHKIPAKSIYDSNSEDEDLNSNNSSFNSSTSDITESDVSIDSPKEKKKKKFVVQVIIFYFLIDLIVGINLRVLD